MIKNQTMDLNFKPMKFEFGFPRVILIADGQENNYE